MIDYTYFKPLLNKLFYRGTCSVEIMMTVKDPETKKSEKTLKEVFSDLPCLLSHESKEVSESRELPNANQKIMLILDPDPILPAGSKITVTQDGITEVYKHSGVANRFPGHQEVELELWQTAT